MASTSTLTYQEQDSLHSQYLSTSLSSLSSSRSTNSFIVRSYKQASQLYLTKRFKEALETIEPVVTPQRSEHINGEAETNGAHPTGAPIAQSSRGTRTKVWTFYLSLLHAIIELGADEGRDLFGSTTWRDIAAEVRSGSIWEEVIQRGYNGNEGDVDAGVVVDLSTLLLGHMSHQRLNQQRLETYLAKSDGNGSNDHLSYSQDGVSTPMSSSSSSPKSLASRLKILELYTLQVLPANDEWAYAKSFIEMSDMLDEERREAFLSALLNLKDEKDGTAQRTIELEERREREMEERRKEQEEDAKKAEEARRLEESKREEEMRRAAEAERQSTSPSKPSNGSATTRPTPIPKPSSSSHATPSRTAKSQKKPPSPPPTFYRRASSIIANFHNSVLQASRSMTVNWTSMALLRLLMFVMTFLLIISRRDLRMELKRALNDSWVKVRQTVGMGVKVTYI